MPQIIDYLLYVLQIFWSLIIIIHYNNFFCMCYRYCKIQTDRDNFFLLSKCVTIIDWFNAMQWMVEKFKSHYFFFLDWSTTVQCLLACWSMEMGHMVHILWTAHLVGSGLLGPSWTMGTFISWVVSYWTWPTTLLRRTWSEWPKPIVSACTDNLGIGDPIHLTLFLEFLWWR